MPNSHNFHLTISISKSTPEANPSKASWNQPQLSFGTTPQKQSPPGFFHFLIGNPCKPSFVTVGVDRNYYTSAWVLLPWNLQPVLFTDQPHLAYHTANWWPEHIHRLSHLGFCCVPMPSLQFLTMGEKKKEKTPQNGWREVFWGWCCFFSEVFGNSRYHRISRMNAKHGKMKCCFLCR